MILIADSGSTKTDWAWLSMVNAHAGIQTAGYNPFHVSDDFITDDICASDELMKIAPMVSHLFFYGAGCSTDIQCSRVKSALGRVFNNAEIEVKHDLLGAARSVFSGESSYVSILGTGSNCCFFDGVEVHTRNPSLGFILGDEASGNWFGKQVLRDFYYRRLPSDLSLDLDESLKLSLPETLDALYNRPRPNAYLASVIPVLHRHRHNDYAQRLLNTGFRIFAELHILPFEPEDTPCHFVGSVAYFFKEELVETLDVCGLQVGTILRAPIDGLRLFHGANKAG